MIIVNYFHEKGYDPTTDGYILMLAGIVNDYYDIFNDGYLIEDAINNDSRFNPKEETMYEIQLIRGTISADPIPEPCFVIDRIIEKKYNSNGEWITPLINT